MGSEVHIHGHKLYIHIHGNFCKVYSYSWGFMKHANSYSWEFAQKLMEIHMNIFTNLELVSGKNSYESMNSQP